jgi:MFS family permease
LSKNVGINQPKINVGSQPSLAPSTGEAFSTRYRWIVLALLVAIYSFNWLDRFIFIILMETIKEDLNLSNTQLGLLSGFVFSAVYSLMGLPIARLADRSNRRNIIVIGLTFWSVMTVFCGFAQSFVQLAVARFGVGIGESSCSPSAYALISDFFSQRQRATAFAIYGLGIYFGISGGLMLGGWINEAYGWRTAFLVAGIPGILLALIFWLVVEEPKRGQSDGKLAADDQPLSTAELFTYLRTRKVFAASAIGIGFFMFTGNAIETWAPTFLIRVYGMSSGEVGSVLGTLSAFGGISGLLVTGLVADRLSKRDLRWYLWIPTICGGMMIPSIALFLILPGDSKFVFYLVAVFFGAGYLAPIIAITQRIVPVRMRAMSSAIVLLSLNFIGIGSGTLFAGFMTDVLTPVYGQEALRYALLLNLSGSVVGIGFMLYSASRLDKELSN